MTSGFRLSLAITSWNSTQRIGPVPLGDDHIPLGPCGRGGASFGATGSDAIGPVREHLERALTPELAKLLIHLRAIVS